MVTLSLRVKIFLSVGLIIFIVMGTSTLVHIRELKQDYLEAIEWRAEALAQGILSNIRNLQTYSPNYHIRNPGLLTGFSHQITQLYDLNKTKNVTYIGIMNPSGVIASHNDQTLWNTTIESPVLLEQLKEPHLTTILEADVYHTLIPIIWGEEMYLGSIAIGFPQQAVDKKVNTMLLNSIGLFGLYLLLANFMITVIMHLIVTKPLKLLVAVGQKIAGGELQITGSNDSIALLLTKIKTHDEIGVLTSVFQDMISYLHDVAVVATQISRGDLQQDVVPRSEKDVLGTAFHQMTSYLKNMGQIAGQIAWGDLRKQITPRSENDQIGTVFFNMQKGLIELIAKIHAGADRITEVSMNVLNASSKQFDALEQIGNNAEVTSYAMQKVGTSVEEVRDNTDNLTAAVNETSASVSEMVMSIKQVAKNSRSLSQFAEDTTAKVVNILKSLEQIADRAEHSKMVSEATTNDAVSGQQSVEKVINSISGISKVTENISNTITQLRTRSSEIGTILDVINEVAEQTRLLSLNAAIIAAQAGVHGRGFAVVADEIKELADRVGVSTKEIAQIVQAVQRDSADAVRAIEQGQKEVENGVAIAQGAGDALQKIAHSAENSSLVAAEIADLVRQQTQTHTQIVDSIQDVSNMINEISRATQEQERKSSQLFIVVEHMQELDQQVSQVLEATSEQQQNTVTVIELMEGVTKLVEENSQIVYQLTDAANELALQANELNHQVDRFVIPEQPSKG